MLYISDPQKNDAIVKTLMVLDKLLNECKEFSCHVHTDFNSKKDSIYRWEESLDLNITDKYKNNSNIIIQLTLTPK